MALLFCCAAGLVFPRPAEILAAVTVLLGDQTIEATVDSDTQGSAEAFQTTAGTSGAVASLTVYVDASNKATQLTVGLYTNSSGRPHTLLSQSSNSSFTAGAWNTVAIPSVAVTAKTVYWIAILGTGGTLKFRDGGTSCSSIMSSQTTLTTLPASWSAGHTSSTCRLSAYGSTSGSAPILFLSKSSASFSATQGSTTNPPAVAVNLTNTGSGTLNFTTSSDSTWLSATASGSAPATLQVAATLGSMKAGTYTGHITVTATGAQNSPATITATFTVAAPPPALSLSTTTLSFGATQGSGTSPAAASVGVTNTGGGALSFKASSDSSWLSVSPKSGTAPNTLQISAALGTLSANTYTGHITVTASGAQGSPGTITVTFTVVPPPAVLSLSATTASFSGTQNSSTNPAPASVGVSNTGGGTLAFTTSSDSYWLSVSSSAGTAPATLTLATNLVGMSASTYTGHVTVTPTGSQAIPGMITVNLVVAPPPPVLSVSPQNPLTFTALAGGGADPAPSFATVSNTGGGSFSFTASSNQAWLSVSSTSSTVDSNTPATLQISASAAGLAANSYQGLITVSAVGVQGSAATIPVTLDVTAPVPPVLLGDTAIESQIQTVPMGQAVAFPVAAAADGSLGSLTVYLDSQSTVSQLAAGLYADNGSGAPGQLLGQQGLSTDTLVAGGWNQIAFPAAVDLTAQTPYWIALLGTQGGSSIYRVATAGACTSASGGDTGLLNALDQVWTAGATSSSCPVSAFGSAGSTPTVFSLSGVLAPPSGGGSLATVALTGSATTSTISGGDGSYIFNGLINGSYTVTPTNTGFVFTPGSQNVAVNGANAPNVNFAAAVPPQPIYTISGIISGPGGVNAPVALNGGSIPVAATADAAGNYSFSGLLPGDYVVTPGLAGYIYTPSSQSVSITNQSLSGVNFTSALAPPTYSISGVITSSANGSGAGATLTLSGVTSATTTADPSSGKYTFSGLVNGAYTVTPSAANAAFNPASQSVTISGADKTAVNFTAVALLFYDDFSGPSLSSDWFALNVNAKENSQLECYVPSQDTLSGGYLVITSILQSTTCSGTTQNYASGAVVWSTFNFTYGTIEFRAEMPGGSGPWPAIWMLGHNCQPSSPTIYNASTCRWHGVGSEEIDIAEILNSNHTVVNQGGFFANGTPDCRVNATDVSQNFHVYDLVWSVGSLTWKIDGTTTCTAKESDVPSQAMYLIINTAVGGTSGGTVVNSTLPQTMQVDYVKVTQP